MAMKKTTEDDAKKKWLRNRDVGHFLSGGGASMVNIIITFPVNKLMFRQQLYDMKTTTAFQQLTQEGALTLYRGLLPPLIQKTASVSIMFGFFHHFEGLLKQQVSPISATVIAAVSAGAIETALTPLERIQTLLQDPRHHKAFRNTKDAFIRVYSRYGMAELFRGATPILYRNTSSNALFFALRDRLHPHTAPPQISTEEEETTTKNPSGELSTLAHHFLSGAAIGGICSTATYPINVIKTRMQSSVGGDMESFGAVFKVVYNERGRSWRRLYRGIHLNLFRSVLSWGIINAAYETLIRFF